VRRMHSLFIRFCPSYIRVLEFLFFDIKLSDIFVVYVLVSATILNYFLVTEVRYNLSSLSRLTIPLAFVIHFEFKPFGLLCLYTHTHTHARTHAHIYIYKYIHIHTYIHTYTSTLLLLNFCFFPCILSVFHLLFSIVSLRSPRWLRQYRDWLWAGLSGSRNLVGARFFAPV
jgi:hypothetical protein